MLSKIIYKILSEAEELEALKGQIYPLRADENTDFPFMVYKIDAVTPAYTKDGLVGDDVTKSFRIVGDKYDVGFNLSQAVRKLLDNSYKEENNILQSRMTSGYEDFQDDAFVQALTFDFKYKY